MTHDRGGRLLSAMTLEEKLAQLVGLWEALLQTQPIGTHLQYHLRSGVVMFQTGIAKGGRQISSTLLIFRRQPGDRE